jgi:hypothetical protein
VEWALLREPLAFQAARLRVTELAKVTARLSAWLLKLGFAAPVVLHVGTAL